MALVPPMLRADGGGGAGGGCRPTAPRECSPQAQIRQIVHQGTGLAWHQWQQIELKRLELLRQIKFVQLLQQQQVQQARPVHGVQPLPSAAASSSMWNCAHRDRQQSLGMCLPGECADCDSRAAASAQAALSQQLALLQRRGQQLKLLQQQAAREQASQPPPAHLLMNLTCDTSSLSPLRRPLQLRTPPAARWRERDGTCGAGQRATDTGCGGSSSSTSVAAWRATQSLNETLASCREAAPRPCNGHIAAQQCLAAPSVSLATAAAAAALARGEAPGSCAASFDSNRRILVPPACGGGSMTPSERGDMSSGWSSATPPRHRPASLLTCSRPGVHGGKDQAWPSIPSQCSVSSTHAASQSELASVGFSTVVSSAAPPQDAQACSPCDSPTLRDPSPHGLVPLTASQDPASRMQWLQAERDALESWLACSSTTWEVLERRTKALRECRERQWQQLEQHAEALQRERQVEEQQLREESVQKRLDYDRLEAHVEQLATELAAAQLQLQEQAPQHKQATAGGARAQDQTLLSQRGASTDDRIARGNRRQGSRVLRPDVHTMDDGPSERATEQVQRTLSASVVDLNGLGEQPRSQIPTVRAAPQLATAQHPRRTSKTRSSMSKTDPGVGVASGEEKRLALKNKVTVDLFAVDADQPASVLRSGSAVTEIPS